MGNPTDGHKPDWHLSPPVWAAGTIWDESVLFLRPAFGQPADGTLLLRPDRVLAVRLICSDAFRTERLASRRRTDRR